MPVDVSSASHFFYLFLAMLRAKTLKSKPRYNHFIKEIAADSVANMFTKDGNLGDVAHGRDSIRLFLTSFKGIKVLSVKSTTASIAWQKDTAIQTGMYFQKGVIQQKDTFNVKGKFIATWERQAKGVWFLKKMQTKPTK